VKNTQGSPKKIMKKDVVASPKEKKKKNLILFQAIVIFQSKKKIEL